METTPETETRQPAPAADEATMLARTEEVLALIAQGKRNGEIKKTCAAAWGLSTRSVEPYITEARQRLREDMGLPRRDLQFEMVAKLEAIANNPNVAALSRLRAFENIAKILGLYQPQGISIIPEVSTEKQQAITDDRKTVFERPDYLEFLRQRAVKEDADDGDNDAGDGSDRCERNTDPVWKDGDEGAEESGSAA